MRDCWSDLERAGASELAGVLPEHAAVLRLAGTPGTIGGGSGAPHTLITYCSDGDALVALTLLPSSEIGPDVEAALAAVNGRVFAGSADLDPATWDAAVKVLAVLAAEHPSVEQLAEYAQIEGSALTADELRPFWNLAAHRDVRSWDQLVVPIDRAYSLRRAH